MKDPIGQPDIELLVAERRKNAKRSVPRTGSSIRKGWRELKFVRGITTQDRTTFLSQLSLMLRARVSLVRSLEILLDQTRSSKMKAVIADVLKDVKRGSSFSVSLSRQPQVFDPLLVVTAEVGEESGRLPDVLSSLAEHMERMSALKKKVTQALAYPFLVLSVALVVVCFLLLYIVPTFADMFRSAQVEIPYATQLVIDASEFLSGYWLYLLLAVAAGVILWRYVFRAQVNRGFIEEHGIRLPWVGTIMITNYTARFCRTLGTLLQSQVPLIDALDVTKRIFTSESMKVEIERLIKYVRQGRAVAEPLSTSKLFSPMVAQMIAVGEETSELETMLLKVASFYEQEIADKMETLTTVIEPILIVFLGIIVGTVLITMYLPMFEMANAVGGG
ncbi:MAG: type II secretion system F family protein [Candidatus Kryptoniota bacterium]